MLATYLRPLALLFALCPLLPALQDAPKSDKQKLRGFGVYSKTTSRQLFAAADLNGDDRIRFFEAQKTIFEARDARGFRRFDTDRDGEISFREFDVRFRELTQLGQELHLLAPALIRLARGIETPQATTLAVQRFFAGLDRNGDGRIDLSEWRGFESLLQPMLDKKAEESFRELDVDKSGTLTPRELEALAPKLDLLLSGLRRSTPPRQLRPLPESLQAADRNGNSRLELDELRYALARIHPSLTRHAADLHRRVDQNRDGALDSIELSKALGLDKSSEAAPPGRR